jgi:hypothetical protein
MTLTRGTPRYTAPGTPRCPALASPVFKVPEFRTLAGCIETYPSIQLPYGSATVVTLTHPSYYDVNGAQDARGSDRDGCGEGHD